MKAEKQSRRQRIADIALFLSSVCLGVALSLFGYRYLEGRSAFWIGCGPTRALFNSLGVATALICAVAAPLAAAAFIGTSRYRATVNLTIALAVIIWISLAPGATC